MSLSDGERQKLMSEVDRLSRLSDWWMTPDTEEQPILTIVAKVFGGEIGLDPCADITRRVKARHHFTEVENCLIQPWSEKSWAFMNPPFSNPKPYIKKMVEQYKSGAIPGGIGLFKSGVMNNKGTGSIIGRSCSAYCLWGGENTRRIAFFNPKTGKPQHGADFDCCLVLWGDRVAAFKEIFAQYGTIVRPQR